MTLDTRTKRSRPLLRYGSFFAGGIIPFSVALPFFYLRGPIAAFSILALIFLVSYFAQIDLDSYVQDVPQKARDQMRVLGPSEWTRRCAISAMAASIIVSAWIVYSLLTQ